MAFMPEGIIWIKYADKKERENIQKMKTKWSQKNWLFSFKGGDEAWQCLNQERQTTSLSGSPSAMLRGLDCILMESGAPRHTLCYSHAKLCLVPRPLQVLSQLSAIVCLASSAPHASPTWRNCIHCSQLCTWQHGITFTEFSMDIMPLAPMKKCCEIKPVKLAILLCSDVQKSLSCFTKILSMWAPRECLPAPVIVEAP